MKSSYYELSYKNNKEDPNIISEDNPIDNNNSISSCTFQTIVTIEE